MPGQKSYWFLHTELILFIFQLTYMLDSEEIIFHSIDTEIYKNQLVLFSRQENPNLKARTYFTRNKFCLEYFSESVYTFSNTQINVATRFLVNAVRYSLPTFLTMESIRYITGSFSDAGAWSNKKKLRSLVQQKHTLTFSNKGITNPRNTDLSFWLPL